MVAIPKVSDPTLDAMKIYYLATVVDEPRDYLGASIIGNPCPRQIWYDIHHYKKQPFSAETRWNFLDGHHVEKLIADRLRLVPGIELWTHDENGKQFERTAHNGRFKAHPDGIIRGLIQCPKTTSVWENKASGQKKFNEFQSFKQKFGDKEALKNWNESYWVQAQILMHLFEIDRHYMTVALAGGREIDSCRTEYIKDVAEKYLDRALKVLDAKEAPARISDKSDHFICRWCNFHDICHK